MSSVTAGFLAAFDRLWTAACWPLIGVLNVIFKPEPQSGAVSLWRIGLWLVANLALFYVAVTQLNSHGLLWTLIVFLLIHILIIASSLRIMYEEKRVMEGTLKPDAMTFSVFDAVNNLPILATSVAFYIAGFAALIEAVERSGFATILRRRPALSSEFGSYLTCVLNEVPLVSTLINAWANLVHVSDNLTAQIVYNGWTGNGVRVLIVMTVSLMVVRALVLRLQQWSQQVSMAHAIESGTASPDNVRKRLVRVPTTLRNRLLTAALTNPDSFVRRRALSAMARLEVPHFARDFLMKLDTHLERDLGLAHIREALATMSSSARDQVAGEIAPLIEKQMGSIVEAIDLQTKQRLQEIRSILRIA